jgi:hypothetical protein
MKHHQLSLMMVQGLEVTMAKTLSNKNLISFYNVIWRNSMNFLSMIWHTFGVMTNQGLKLEEVDV